MGIQAQELLDCIIKPCLELMQMNSQNAQALILGTCFAESQGGTFLRQIKGPALGIYQMEPATHDDIVERVLKKRMPAISEWRSICNPMYGQSFKLVYDLYLATGMCRLQYSQFEEAIPKFGDLNSLATYWLKYYNRGGRGTGAHFIDSWNRNIGDVVWI